MKRKFSQNLVWCAIDFIRAAKQELSDNKDVDFTYLYMGPVAMISGRLVEK